MSPQIVRKPRISRKAAQEMVLLFAKSGNHFHLENFTTDASVQRAFRANGKDFSQVVEACRNPNVPVPFFENLIGSTWTVSGGTVARVNLATGEELTKVEGPGIFVPDGYWAIFESSAQSLNRAIETASYQELLTAVVNGIASIESFINAQAENWNRSNPDHQLVDSKIEKVSFEDKIDRWIPIITKGKRHDKSGKKWQSFKILQSIRDNEAIHPKESGYGVQFSKIVEIANLFPIGIAGSLIDLHLLFKQRIPAIIIRNAYLPDVEIPNECTGSV